MCPTLENNKLYRNIDRNVLFIHFINNAIMGANRLTEPMSKKNLVVMM